MRSEGSSQHRSDGRSATRLGLVCLIGLVLSGICAAILWPAIERNRYSENSRPLIDNQRSVPILVFSVDAAGGVVHQARIEPGESQHVVIAQGDVEAEFVTRTIHVIVTDERGVEVGRATFTGRVGEKLKSIIVAEIMELRGVDDTRIDAGNQHDKE